MGSIFLFVGQLTHSLMDSKNEDVIASKAQKLKEKRNENVRKIKEQLNSSRIKPTNRDLIQEKSTNSFKAIKENLDEKFVGLCLVVVMAFFLCCFCGQDKCYGSVILAVPILISKKAFCWTLLKIINLLRKIPCEDDTKLISTPPVIEEKLTELAKVFQDEDTED